VTDDGFLSLLGTNGETKDDVKLPEGEVGDKIKLLFLDQEKDTSTFICHVATSTLKSLTINCITDVTLQSAMGEVAAVDAKEAPAGKA